MLLIAVFDLHLGFGLLCMVLKDLEDAVVGSSCASKFADRAKSFYLGPSRPAYKITIVIHCHRLDFMVLLRNLMVNLIMKCIVLVSHSPLVLRLYSSGSRCKHRELVRFQLVYSSLSPHGYIALFMCAPTHRTRVDWPTVRLRGLEIFFGPKLGALVVIGLEATSFDGSNEIQGLLACSAVVGSEVAPRKTQPSLTVAKRFRCLVLDIWATIISNGTNEQSPKRRDLESHTVIIVIAL